LISDRNKPIAKIVPLHNTSEFSAEELALAAGILRLPEESEISEIFQIGAFAPSEISKFLRHFS
jgi:antitoxin (DNA-binding transcriptional repressor) of toxin-antitoxin stability system